MRTTIRKWFWAWDFDKEEAWLNEMAARGLCLASVGWCRYEFEDCVPGEYSVRLELLQNNPGHPESRRYLEFLEETGAEHVGSYLKWVYLKKRKDDGEFELFSDNESRIRHLSRIIQFVAWLAGLNVFIGLYNIFILFVWDSEMNMLGIVNLLIGVLGGYGAYRLHTKRKHLKNERVLYE